MTGSESRWAVQVDTPFRRDIHRLPPRIAAGIGTFVLMILPENPVRMSKPLRGRFAGLRVARRGSYRVILELDEETRTITLIRVDHRAHIYYRPPRPAAGAESPDH